MDPLKFLRAQLDRVVAASFGIAGLVVMLLGWLGTSRTVYPAEQIPYLLSGGIIGLVLVAVAATLWISADLRDEWRKLDRLEELLRDRSSSTDTDSLYEATPPDETVSPGASAGAADPRSPNGKVAIGQGNPRSPQRQAPVP